MHGIQPKAMLLRKKATLGCISVTIACFVVFDQLFVRSYNAACSAQTPTMPAYILIAGFLTLLPALLIRNRYILAVLAGLAVLLLYVDWCMVSYLQSTGPDDISCFHAEGNDDDSLDEEAGDALFCLTWMVLAWLLAAADGLFTFVFPRLRAAVRSARRKHLRQPVRNDKNPEPIKEPEP